MAIPTNLISTVLIPLFSLSGILAGLALSYLAQEEIAAGKKYFIMMYRMIFILLLLSITYFLSFRMILIFVACGIVLSALDFIGFKKYFKSMFIIHYLFFLSGYFISGQQLIIAAILFLYGLPIGTLLRLKRDD